VIDWKYYEIMYGERYMDSPEENPEGYQSTSLIPMASKLKGDLLLIHGYIDPVVVIQHSLTFIRECISNNIPVDYFVYPRAEHNVRGKDRIHLMQKVTDYFEEKLK
jgi:dipeptidyl-peptidase-4